MLEDRLFTPASTLEEDIQVLAGGSGIIVAANDQKLHYIVWIEKDRKLPSGYQLHEYLRSEDRIHDTDIVLNGVRYSTLSGHRLAEFFIVKGNDHQTALQTVYGTFLDPSLRSIDRPNSE